MSRALPINFYGFWTGFGLDDFLSYHPYLKDSHQLTLSDEPELAICGPFADKHAPPTQAIKVFFTGENVTPAMDRFDWAMSFTHMNPPNPRHLRLPMYAWYLRRFSGGLERLIRQPGERAGLQRPRFCNFVFRNKECQERIELFRKLSSYKHIDAPGKCMNNMPGFDESPDGDAPAKWRFLRNYKFTIAYENAQGPGYTTEKIADAMAARSIPIYWGNPLVHLDFNPKSFLNRHDFDSDEAFIAHIIRVDQDDELYTKIFSEPYWHNNAIPEAINDSTCLAFWNKVFASRALARHTSEVY